MKIPGCETCGKPINWFGFCDAACRKAFVNNPIRGRMEELARIFRTKRNNPPLRTEEQMADFAMHMFELFGVQLSEELLTRFYDSGLRPLKQAIKRIPGAGVVNGN